MPQEITIALLRNAMKEAVSSGGKTLAGHDVAAEHKDKWTDGKGRFLIDGFPRKMDQALGFDETVSYLTYPVMCSSLQSAQSNTFLLLRHDRCASLALSSSYSAVKKSCLNVFSSAERRADVRTTMRRASRSDSVCSLLCLTFLLIMC